MILTRKQQKRLKLLLMGTGIVFMIQIGFPHLAFAAHENQRARAEGEHMRYVARLLGLEVYEAHKDILLARAEKMRSVADDDRDMHLPMDNEPSVVDEVWLTVTAYSSEPRQTDDTPFTTAWQTPVRDGVVALNFLPKGTLVRFPALYGDKVFVVEDRMNARYTFRADIWMYTRTEAIDFGMKYTNMEILRAQLPRDYVLSYYEPAFPGMK